MTNQWPEFEKLPRQKSIRGILLEEGNGVSARTGDEIKFVVETQPHGSGGFMHRCFLLADKLGYRYPLMRVIQEGLDYPVSIVADAFPQEAVVGNEADFRKALGIVFQSEPVKKVVPQLLEMVA
jgi:hypothetical protein